MREIKLRVWDKIKHRMFIPGNDQHDSLFAFEGGRVIYYNLQNGDGSGADGGYTIMQSTGLRDARGQEIYEGDILKKRDYEETTIGAVKFGIFEDGWGHKNIGFYYDDLRTQNELFKHRPDLLIWVKDQKSLVVGNIFQNPELVEMAKTLITEEEDDEDEDCIEISRKQDKNC